jgi:nuclear pore complex protein Nup53
MTRLQDITMTGALHTHGLLGRSACFSSFTEDRLLLVTAAAAAADAEPLSGSSPLGGGAAAGFPEQSSGAAAPQQQQQDAAAQQQADDTWVTVYGFTPDDLPLVLKEFQRCGDILQWGTFGASPQSNFMHIQYQNKYGAQRAQLRSGEQLTSSLIIGVKQLEPKHRALVAAWAGGADGSPGPRVKAASLRPYRVEVPAAQVLPQRSRSWAQKVGEYVFGL